MKKVIITSAALCASLGFASAASLNLSYNISPDGGLFLYNMTLSVDQTASGWAPGMGWGWIVFGDVTSGSSPINDFAVTSGFPIGPWTELDGSSGGHNGPTLGPVANGSGIIYWVPNTASDTLTWSGTSSYQATPGSLQFSELFGEGGASTDNFKNMIQLSPEPTSILALAGLIPMILIRRRARK